MNTNEQAAPARLWKPCRCCGCREVTKIGGGCSAEAGKEWVIVECSFCESRRGAYLRKRKPASPERKEPNQ